MARELEIRITGDNSDLLAKQQQAEKGFTELGVSAQKMATNYNAAIKATLTSVFALGAGFVTLGTAAIAAGLKMDEALDTIRVRTGAVGPALKDLETSFRNVFKTVPNDAKEVSFALAELASRLNLTGKPLEALTTQFLTLARITRTDINVLIPAATRLFQDWSVATEKQATTLDFLFRVYQQTGVSVQTLIQGVTDTGAAFRALGFDFESAAALIGQFEKEGVNAQQVISALQIAARKFADQNIPLAEGLKAVVDRIRELGPGTEAAKLSVEVFGRSSAGMAEAIQRGRLNVDDLVKSLRASKETIQGAAKDVDGFSENWRIFRNNLILALEPLGTRLLKILEDLQPAFMAVVGALVSLGEGFGKLGTPVQVTIIAFAGIVAAAGPAVIAINGMVTAVTALRGALTLLSLNPLTLGFAAVGGAAIYAAVEIHNLNERTKAWIQQQHDARNIEEIYNKIKTGVALTAAETENYKQAVERQNQSLDRSRATFQGLGGDYKGFEAAIDPVAQAQDKAAEAAKKHEAWLAKLTGTAKQNEDAAKKLAAQINAERDALESLGLITAPRVAQRLAELNLLWSRGVAEGIPLEILLKRFIPEYEELAKNAAKSGVSMEALNEQLALQKSLLPQIPSLSATIGGGMGELLNVGVALKNITGETLEATRNAVIMRQAYETFGVKTRDELQRTAQDLRQHYEDLVQAGNISERDRMAALERVLEAERLAAEETVSIWRDFVFPSLRQVAIDVEHGFTDVLAQSLVHLRSFKDGAVELFHSLQRAIANILSDLLSFFINHFVRGMLNALTGGSFRSAFAGAFSGVGGIGSLLGMGPGAAAGGSFVSSAVTGTAAAASGGTGGALGAIGGFLTNPFTIGIGAAALGGLALWNRQNNVTAKSREEFAQQQGFGNLGDLYAHLQGMGAGGEALANVGLNVIGRKDETANRKWMNDVLQFLQTAQTEAQKLQQDVQSLGLTWEDMGASVRGAKLDELGESLVEQTNRAVKAGYEYDKVIAKQAQSYSELYGKAVQFGEKLPASLQPVLEALIRMGLLVDANGNKITELGLDMFDAVKSIAAPIDEATTKWRIFGRVVEDASESASFGWRKVRQAIEDSSEAVSAFGRRIGSLPSAPGVPGAETEPFPSFQGRPLERVTRAGVAMLHPGDVVGVPSHHPPVSLSVPIQLGGQTLDTIRVEIVESRAFAEIVDRAAAANTYGLGTAIRRSSQ